MTKKNFMRRKWRAIQIRVEDRVEVLYAVKRGAKLLLESEKAIQLLPTLQARGLVEKPEGVWRLTKAGEALLLDRAADDLTDADLDMDDHDLLAEQQARDDMKKALE